jgi:N-acetyl-gamma-glutamyl-phosphate reductase
MSISVGIVGASGFAGIELIKLLGDHPEFNLAVAGSNSLAGTMVSSIVSGLNNNDQGLKFSDQAPENFMDLDLVLMALPHATSVNLVPILLEKYSVKHVVDLSADFRLKESKLYNKYYGFDHPEPDLLSKAVFGLPEINRTCLKDAKLVAVAGCYVTAVSLALYPFMKSEVVVNESVIADCASGVTGAGKKLTETTQFTTVNENYSAYGLLNHRHRPEIEQVLGVPVVFTPHLLPVDRGILATCYFKVKEDVSESQLKTILNESYSEEYFIKVTDSPPDLKSVVNTNLAKIFVTLDKNTQTAIVISAIDNLVKGAAGQAVQCANAVFGLAENLGLK